MTYVNVKSFFGVTRRLVIPTIIATFMIGIFYSLMICIQMMTVMLASKVLQASKNYEGFSN